MKQDFIELTEISGTEVSAEQVERIIQRYYWAGEYCRDADVLEVACGTGQGIGYLATVSRTIKAGDYSEAILAIARRHYGTRFEFDQFDAQQIPYPDRSFDVILIFEAIYYLPKPESFFAECRRLLRPGGVLLIVTANKDLFDFNPSAHSFTYFGVVEMGVELAKYGFECEFFGGYPLKEVSARQKALRPIKMVAAKLGLIPKSMRAKKLLKRFIFGGLVKMPPEIGNVQSRPPAPTPLPTGVADTSHKVLFCAATLRS